jgi:Protein of unknown function (DUF3572)
MRRRTTPDPEILALRGVAFLAGLPSDLEQFLALSGLTAEDMRLIAGDPEFLAGLLDFLLGTDSLLLAFCDAESLEPGDVHLARAKLSAGR